jgi:hypothetical protein
MDIWLRKKEMRREVTSKEIKEENPEAKEPVIKEKVEDNGPAARETAGAVKRVVKAARKAAESRAAGTKALARSRSGDRLPVYDSHIRKPDYFHGWEKRQAVSWQCPWRYLLSLTYGHQESDTNTHDARLTTLLL